MKKVATSFINGAAILSVAGIIVKILGAIFRIPLTHIIGSEGVGIYQLAYPMYSFLLVISSSGFPVAISKLVAQAVNDGDYKLANRTFRLSKKLMMALGICAAFLLIVFSSVIANLQGNPDSKGVLIAIAPAIFFVTVLSSYRGYFQGMQNMIPTATTQVIEQFIKLIAGLGLAAYFKRYGVMAGAVGAVLGVTLSELCALIYIIFMYNSKRSEIYANIRGMNIRSSAISSKQIIKDVILIALPVAIGAAILPLVSMIDQLIVINGLKKIIAEIPGIPFNIENLAAYAAKKDVIISTAISMTEAAAAYPEIYSDFVQSLATSLYGIMSGTCSPITALPLIFSTSLSISIVPAIAQAHAKRSGQDVRMKSTTGMRLTTLITFPCAIGIFVLAEPIIRTLYGRYSEWEMLSAIRCLRVMSLTVLVLPIIHTSTAILQGLGKQNIPVVNLALSAVVVKIPLTYFLVKIPSLNIIGATIGTISIFTVAAVLDVLCVKYFTRVKFNSLSTFMKPLGSSVTMGVVAFTVYMLFSNVMSNINGSRIFSQIIPMGIAILAAVLVYAALVLLSHSLQRSDLKFIPKGDFLEKKIGRFLD